MLDDRYPEKCKNTEQDETDPKCRGEGRQVAVHNRMSRRDFIEQNLKVVRLCLCGYRVKANQYKVPVAGTNLMFKEVISSVQPEQRKQSLEL